MSEGMVQCPGCQAEYDGSGYDPGDRFQCPECNTIVTIPGGAAKASAAPKAAARGGTHRMSRGGTGRASRPPASRGTSKMNVVNNAVGMGALDPTVDPRAIRRAAQAPAPVQQDGGEKMLLYGGVGVVAIAIIGLIIYIAKQPSAEDKKKAGLAKKAAAEAKEKEEAATSAATEKPPDRPRPPADAGWDADPAVDAEVISTLAILKSHPVDESFWRTASKLLRHGRALIPCLVQKWAGEADVANASRLIVDRAVVGGPKLPEGLFESASSRAAMIMEYRHWWVNEPKGQAAQLVSEQEFTGGAAASNPPPSNPPPSNPGGTGSGVTEIKKTGGGVSESAMRRDLPQHLSNFARGTFEDRQKTLQEIRKYGKQVIPALINALKEEDIAMANAANDLLKEFTKQDQGRVPGEPGDRPPFIKKWEDWWKGAEGSFTM